MDIRKLQRAIVDGLEDVKGQHIVVFNTEHLSPLFERVIIASGTSNRQTKALASSVRETVKGRGLQVLRTEGEENGEWIIVDCGAAVVHLMQPAIRTYYHLEEIWGGKPVNIKLGSSETKLVKASEDISAKPTKPTKPTKPAKPGPRKLLGPITEKKAAPPAKKAAATKPAAKKPAPAKKAASRVVGSKTPATKTITVGAAKPAAKRAAARPAARPAAQPAARPAARPAAKTAAKTATKRPAATKVAAKKVSKKA
jgi:ribosome-associated protein